MRPEDFEGWLHKTALGMTGRADHDDLVQEGRIALWRAWERADKDAPGLAGYLTMAAKGRMIDVATGARRLTGQEAPEGRVITTEKGRQARDRIREYLKAHPDASGVEIARGTGLSPATVSVQRKRLGVDDEIDAPGSLDALKDAGFDAGQADTVEALIEQAYMVGQVGRALEVLTANQRRYVSLRFWEGYTPQELRDAFGYDPAAVWREAKVRLRPVLEDLLVA